MALGDWQKRVLGGANRLMSQLGMPIAIDFGCSALKLLQLQGGDSPTLVAAGCLTTPDELMHDHAKRLAFQMEALPKLVKSCGFKTRRAVCAIPSSQSYVRHMQFTVEPGVSLAQLVKSALGQQTGCDPANLVFRHIEVGQIGRSNKTEAICMAASRELVGKLMNAMKAAKLEPVGMHMEATAAIKPFDAITRRDEDVNLTSLYLDMGAGTTNLMIAHGRNLVFTKNLPIGGRDLDAAASKQLKVVLRDARTERLKLSDFVRAAPTAEAKPATGMAVLAAAMKKAGAGAETAVLEDRRHGMPAPGLTEDLTRHARMEFNGPRIDLTETIESLTDEIAGCLRYHESVFPDRRVNRAIFMGGESRHLGLAQHIARTLRLPAQVADPMASVGRTGKETTPGVDFRLPQPGWAMSMGLCLSPTDL
jgi:type IV pilus assembly protein PilM